MNSGFGGGRTDGGGFFVEVAEEIVEGAIDFDVHIERRMDLHLDWLNGDAQTTGQQQKPSEHRKNA